MIKDDADATDSSDRPAGDYLNFLESFLKTPQAAPHCDGRLLHDPSKCWACAIPEYKPLHEFRAKYDISYSGESNRKYPCPVEAIRSVKQAHQWGVNSPRTAEQRDSDFARFREELTRAMDQMDQDYTNTCNNSGIGVELKDED